MSNFKSNYRGNRNKQPRRNNYDKKAGDDTDINNPVIASFRHYARELDEKHDRYERIFKHSRDITIESKRIIFSLHTVDFRKDNHEQVLKDALTRLTTLCQTHFANIAEELQNVDPYQYSRAYSGGLQEFIEAYSFYEYVKGSNISDWDVLQEKLTYKKVPQLKNEKENNESEQPEKTAEIEISKEIDNKNENCASKDVQPIVYKCLILPIEFMLGLGDLSGEVMRRCVNSLGNGDFDTCFQATNCLQLMYTGFMGLGQIRNKEISNKIYTLRQSVIKVENVCYNIKVRGGEAAKWGADDPLDKQSIDEDEGFINF